MIVALKVTEGDEGYTQIQRQNRRRPRVGKPTTVSAALHAPIACILGHPCIYFYPKPKWTPYPLVHERNVIPILVHESVHCTLLRRLGENERRAADKWFDNTFFGVEASRSL